MLKQKEAEMQAVRDSLANLQKEHGRVAEQLKEREHELVQVKPLLDLLV